MARIFNAELLTRREGCSQPARRFLSEFEEDSSGTGVNGGDHCPFLTHGKDDVSFSRWRFSFGDS